MSATVLIISAAKNVDSVGSMAHCLALEQRIETFGHSIRQLHIDPLSTAWDSPLRPDHFRSGASPIEALAKARTLIQQGSEHAVLICGEDQIRTGYSRHQRHQLMQIYGPDQPITEAYTELARSFLKQHRVDESQFQALAHALFDNYCLSYRNTLSDDYSPELLPGERWHQPVTSLFRGVDCANPMVDFQGRLLLVSETLAETLDCPPNSVLRVDGVGLGYTEHDGPEHSDSIAHYTHLRQAYRDCCAEAGIDFTARFKQGQALLEVYTCYPVVPMAFLLAADMVELLDEIPAFLEQHRITITGGMNLARAAWNNPALNALIEMHHQLLASPQRWGMVHGNGGLGYRQGVALLSKLD